MSNEAVQSEVLQALFVDPEASNFMEFAADMRRWFGDYIDFTYLRNFDTYEAELNSGKYDVVFAEIIHPDLGLDPRNGLMKVMNPAGAADVPVIIITACDDSSIPVFAFRNGVSEYFSRSDLGSQVLEYRLRNMFRREFRLKILNNHFNSSMSRFQEAHGMSQVEINELNALVTEMRIDLKKEYEEKMSAESERTKVQALFGKYVDPAILDGILKDEISFDHGQKVDIAVLFTDIRGYTMLSEKLDPEQMLSFLNEYFSSMTEVLMGYEGMIDKYIGDSIMCLFGAPVKKEGYRENALQAALEMQAVFQVWQGTWEKNYGILPHMGIGLASGEAVVGNVGSFQKISYTAVGDTVNMAARLEGLAAPGEVLISQNLFDSLDENTKSKYAYAALEPVAIKGKTGLHQVYRVT